MRGCKRCCSYSLVRNFKFVSYIDCFDGRHPNVFVPQELPHEEFQSIEDINNWLGRSQFSADAFFDGTYNEFRIYDGALLDGEVLASFTANLL